MLSKIDIQLYKDEGGKVPFSDWLDRLDKSTQVIVDVRLARIRAGNIGDCKRLSGTKGLFELRIDFGPGLRIYCGRQGDQMIILLCGGVKRSQTRDILKAKMHWQDYLARSKRGRHE